MNILILCNSCTNRSPTFRDYLQNRYKTAIAFRAKGTHAYYGHDMLQREDYDWANLIICMDAEQALHIVKHLDDKCDKMMILGVSDDYTYMEPRLVEIVQFFQHIFDQHAKRAVAAAGDHGAHLL